MDAGDAALNDPADQEATSKDLPEAPGAVEAWQDAAGQGTPRLALDGFEGPLERLLALARAQQVDLGRLSLTALLAQLEAAMRQAPATLPLGQKGDWVVMAAWLLQLRSRLLLPADTSAQQDAAVEADQLRGRLVELQAMQALAAWLERRPRLGHDVFARGRPEIFGVSVEPIPDLDLIEFLWASLALFDDDEAVPDIPTVYRPRLARWHSNNCCRPPPNRQTLNRCGPRGGERPGPARLLPVWNWPSRAMWWWRRRGFFSPSISPVFSGPPQTLNPMPLPVNRAGFAGGSEP
jgi:hypothetical protein